MIFSRISVVFFMVAALSTSAEASSEESLIMRIFNPDYHAPESKMRAALRKADLESHGYTKEVTTALTSKPGSNTPFFEKKHLYYKTVDCSRASEVVQELETLFSDAYGTTVGTKILSEIKARNLTSMKQCKVGVEIHFKNGGGCSSSKSNARSKRSPCFLCIICGWVRSSTN